MTTPFTSYQKRLFAFLSIACFFEGYDFMALTQILPNLRHDLGLSQSEGGYLIAFINIGTVLAFLLVRKADRWGRSRVLMITIAGYTLFTFLSGFAPDVYSFAILQLLARIFLIAEWATSMVIAAEEFPADRRGMVIGVIQGATSLGSIVCAGVAPVLLATEYGWRMVYFVGVIPLVLLAYARRGLRESQRFTQTKQEDEERPSFFRIWHGPYRKRMLQVSLIWATTYLCTNNAITFWKEFVVAERGFTDAQVGASISIAAVGSMPLVFYAGKLIDVIGRKAGAAVIFTTCSVGVALAYGLHGQWPLTAALLLAIFGVSAMLPVLNAFTTELFPTELRGDSFAWCNNLLGRLGYVVAPAFVGIAYNHVGSWGPVIQATTLFPIIAVVMIYRMRPETRGRELEDTAAL